MQNRSGKNEIEHPSYVYHQYQHFKPVEPDHMILISSGLKSDANVDFELLSRRLEEFKSKQANTKCLMVSRSELLAKIKLLEQGSLPVSVILAPGDEDITVTGHRIMVVPYSGKEADFNKFLEGICLLQLPQWTAEQIRCNILRAEEEGRVFNHPGVV
jgi:hypothetical protein